MKRAGFLIEKIAETDNILYAFYKARRGKQLKKEVIAFSNSLDNNIQKLRSSILSGYVDVGNYTYFNINDPKPRKICAAAFHERVLHHSIMNVCHQYFERNLIETTYATRPEKGIYQAIDRAKLASKKYPYVAKFDFRKYFDSIDHSLLKNKLERLFKDKKLLKVFNQIIDSYSTKEDKGLPIGNLTSQYFANHYLSSLDHYVKEDLHVKEYVRYMDDFLVFAKSDEEIDNCIDKIIIYSRNELNLTLKPVIKIKVLDGIPFLGYKIFPNKILLNSRSKKRLRSKIIKYQSYLENNIWEENKYMEHLIPLMAFANKAYSKRLRCDIIQTAGCK